MSRVAQKPIEIPSGVEVKIEGQKILIKGAKGQQNLIARDQIKVLQQESMLTIEQKDESKETNTLAGTTRALLNNIVKGVSQGFERKLILVGVGYRAQAQGKLLNLTLGLSHPVNHPIPEGITIETPIATEIVIKGSDKQLVGQVAADIRSYRPPEPYKGKGIRYANEVIQLKETKKK